MDGKLKASLQRAQSGPQYQRSNVVGEVIDLADVVFHCPADESEK